MIVLTRVHIVYNTLHNTSVFSIFFFIIIQIYVYYYNMLVRSGQASRSLTAHRTNRILYSTTYGDFSAIHHHCNRASPALIRCTINTIIIIILCNIMHASVDVIPSAHRHSARAYNYHYLSLPCKRCAVHQRSFPERPAGSRSDGGRRIGR